jgi:hypothetical protein
MSGIHWTVRLTGWATFTLALVGQLFWMKLGKQYLGEFWTWEAIASCLTYGAAWYVLRQRLNSHSARLRLGATAIAATVIPTALLLSLEHAAWPATLERDWSRWPIETLVDRTVISGGWLFGLAIIFTFAIAPTLLHLRGAFRSG